MSNLSKLAMMAGMLGLVASENLYMDDFPKTIKPFSADGHKCGECIKFKTSRCRMTCNTEKSPACSAIILTR